MKLRCMLVLSGLLLVLGFAGSGCVSTKPAGDWLSADVEASSERVVWEVTRVALSKNNFPLGSGLDQEHMLAVSGWFHSLAPFHDKGFRVRCYVQWTRPQLDNPAAKKPADAPADKSVAKPAVPAVPPANPANQWHVEVRVEREHNADISHPLDLTYSQWEPDPDDKERAGLVLQYIRSLLSSH